MKGRNYDVLLLRPQEIKDVIEIDQAIDLVEKGSPSSMRRAGACIHARTCASRISRAASTGSA